MFLHEYAKDKKEMIFGDFLSSISALINVQCEESADRPKSKAFSVSKKIYRRKRIIWLKIKMFPLSLVVSSRNLSLKPIEAVLISIHKELFYCLSANKSPQ